MITYRENLIRAMRRKNPAFVPVELSFTPPLAEKIRKEFGVENPNDAFKSGSYHANSGHRRVAPAETKNLNDYSVYYRDRHFTGDIDINEWGIARQKGSFMHFTHIESPLINAQNVREIEEYPLPDLDAPYRWQGKKNEVLALQNQGFAVGIGVNHIFETSWQIRGIEQFLSDLYLEYEMCEVLTERIFQIRLGMMKQAAMTGADVIHVGDDVGTQNGMMFSPEIWRKLFKPRLKKLAGAAKNLNPEVLIWYHSDGNIYDIIPDLIEIGIDILNPVQPECMDPYLLKSKYGQDLSFWGILGTQQLLPFGTPQQIRDEIRRLIDIAGKNGGLLLAPTHVLEPEVPLENIAAVIKTIEEYGVYKK